MVVHSQKLHWHASMGRTDKMIVSSLACSPDGSYLLSGGSQGVLVIWPIYSAGRKSFVTPPQMSRAALSGYE